MAVVSISRIQVRRGRKNQGTGLPQLASGEFGWAIDTQELYIGNGAVSEGAPFVGNTKILTQHDDLFQYANSYSYKSNTSYMQTGLSPETPISRPLQDRLDDVVSVRAFGAEGDGTDQTASIQRAIDQLYINPATKSDPKSKVELLLDAGTYLVSGTICVPPFATIRGAGTGKTVIIGTAAGPVFKTVNGLSTPDNPAPDSPTTALNQAREIFMGGMTIQVPSGQAGILLQSCKDSRFNDIQITSDWSNGDLTSNDNAGIILKSYSSAVTCVNNQFERVTVNGMSYGVYSDYDISFNVWFRCMFETLGYGIRFGENTLLGPSGQERGPYNNLIIGNGFNNIDYQGIWCSARCTGNTSNLNKFINVGNEGGSSANALHPVIQFDWYENLSERDWFQRSAELGYSTDIDFATVAYVPEVKGPTFVDSGTAYKITLIQYSTETTIFKLPADTAKAYEVEYLYVSNQVEATRKGTLHIVVDPVNDTVSLSDEYDYTGNPTYEEKLVFSATNFDLNGDLMIDTVAIQVLNSTVSDNANFYYRVKTKGNV